VNPVVYVTFWRWFALWSWADGHDYGRRDDDMPSFGVNVVFEKLRHD
jgi:hypothetical protein